MEEHVGRTSPQGVTSKQTEDAYRKKRTVARSRWTRKVNAFTKGKEGNVSVEVLSDLFHEVKEAYENLETVNSDYIWVELEDSRMKAIERENQEYMEEVECKFTQVLVDLRAVTPRVENVQACDTINRCDVRVRKLEPPAFDGRDIDEYFTFRADYKRITEKQFKRDPFVLKQALSGDALRCVKGADNDYDAMWRRLDERFGNVRLVNDSVVQRVRELKRIGEGDKEGFINLVDTVEICYLKLSSVGNEREFNTSSIVTDIEKVLPDDILKEWVSISLKLTDTSNLFKSLLDFLLGKKRITEYMLASVRSPQTKVSTHAVTAVKTVDNSLDISELNVRLRAQEACNEKLAATITDLKETIEKLAIGRNLGFNKGRTPNRNCLMHATASHDTGECFQFKGLSDKERYDKVRQTNACLKCLERGHTGRECPLTHMRCQHRTRDRECRGHHHTLLHGSLVREVSESHSAVVSALGETFLPVSYVKCKGTNISTLWDSGASHTLITHRLARKLELKGRKVLVNMTMPGRTHLSIRSTEYKLDLIDSNGHTMVLDVIGMDEVAGSVSELDLSDLSKIFNGLTEKELNRPYGALDLLVGIDNCDLLPTVVRTNGKCQLLRNQFGLSMRGKHPLIKVRRNWSEERSDNPSVIINSISIQVNKLMMEVEYLDDMSSKLNNLFDIDRNVTGNSADCPNCSSALMYSGNVSMKEMKELELIDEGLSYSAEEKCFTASYPWIDDPNKLSNNVNVAITRMEGTERRLRKRGHEYAEQYDAAVKDLIDRGVAVALTTRDIRTYNGPVFYLYHHEVLKPDSESTPVRLVFNASAPYRGVTLNDMWAKGPNMLNDLFGVLCRFREDRVAFVGDISKMYHSVKLNELEKHTHRFVWRGLDRLSEPVHYNLCTVTFGDRPAGAICCLALRKIADMFKSECPKVDEMIKRNSYMDDIMNSVSDIGEANETMKQTEFVLMQGGFKIKKWIVSGVDDSTRDVNCGEDTLNKVLGLFWNSKVDKLVFRIKLNFSERINKVRTQPDLTLDNFTTQFPTTLTRRIILSQLAAVFDPLGLALPFLLKGKIMMRELIVEMNKSKANDMWDAEIPQTIHAMWKDFFASMFDLQHIQYDRCLKPSTAVGKPILIIFSDGSAQAYGAVGYVRWHTEEGSYHTRLIAAKSRMTPNRTITIPKIELMGAVMGVRLREMIIRESTWEFEEVVHVTDSQIVRAQIQKSCYAMKSFEATRIAEIQIKSNPCEWWWGESSLNMADYVTKPRMPKDMTPESEWQKGPRFLEMDRNEWPLEQGKENVEVEINACTTTHDDTNEGLGVVKLCRFSTYDKLLRVTARVYNIFKCKSFFGVKRELAVDDLRMAERKWILHVQYPLVDWETRYRRLGPVMREGVVMVGTRIESWLRENWNADLFVLLPYESEFTKLYVKSVHESNHGGVESTLTKVQSKFWIPKLRRMVKTIKGRCVTCRRLDKDTAGQCMGQITDHRMAPSTPFFHCALDIFGHMNIKDTVKCRTKKKVYGVIFVCYSTRAVYLDLTESYNTNDFLTTFGRFISIRGCPSTIHSDAGTQLACASKELMQSLNVQELKSTMANKGIKWTFNRASDAPWENGSSEAMIRLVKRELLRIIGDNILSFGELQSVLFNVANLLNERPIGIKPGTDIEMGTYLCPNDLLLGRATSRTPEGNVDTSENFKGRIKFIQNLTDCFWRKWTRDYWPTLIVRSKWHVEKRDLQKGDVVLIQDSNVVRGKWKLAQVVEAIKGRDGHVRDVTLRYKICKKSAMDARSTEKTFNRSVHKLVVLLPVEEQ